MKCKYYVLYVLLSLLYLFMWYYAVCFCAVYPKSAIGWFTGGIISSLVGSTAMEIGIPFAIAFNRHIALRTKSRY